MRKTPISDSNGLSLGQSEFRSGGLSAGKSRAVEVERKWQQWVYDLGLKLDNLVPLEGCTNAQRIELAINELLDLKGES